MRRSIVAIGGGEIRTGQTREIDTQIIRISKKKKPSFLFIPTASYDSQKYWQVMDEHYRKKLGCNTDVLYLLNKKITVKEIRTKITTADIIYVGGGNTLKMMKRWRFLGVDTLLEKA